MNVHKSLIDDLIKEVKTNAILVADDSHSFNLSSGVKSQHYFDLSKVMLTPHGIAVIVASLYSELFMTKFTAIGGPSSGADPIIGALLFRYYGVFPHVRGFVIPKPKDHGVDAKHEGYLNKKDKVVIIDDVATSGKSLLKTIKIVENAGAEVVKVITIVDRESGAQQLLSGYNYVSLTKQSDYGISN